MERKTESKNWGIANTNKKAMLLSKSAVYDSKRSRFIKQQEASGLIFGDIYLLKEFLYLVVFFLRYKMKEIINIFLIAGDEFMPEMHLRQPESAYSACRIFTKHKEIIEKFKETGDTRYSHQNELDKACF